MSLRGWSVLCHHVLPKSERCIQINLEERCVYHPGPMSNCTMGDAEGSISDSGHGSFVDRVASAGKEQIDWIGPTVHTQRPLAVTRKIAND